MCLQTGWSETFDRVAMNGLSFVSFDCGVGKMAMKNIQIDLKWLLSRRSYTTPSKSRHFHLTTYSI